ncbi:muniscin C-terminal mu homology domain-containing protein, partial [Tanacetum coccineum]
VISRNAAKELVEHELQNYSHSGKNEVKEEKGTWVGLAWRKYGQIVVKQNPNPKVAATAMIGANILAGL